MFTRLRSGLVLVGVGVIGGISGALVVILCWYATQQAVETFDEDWAATR